MAKVAAVKNKKEVRSTELDKMDVFMSTPLLKGRILNLIKFIFPYCLKKIMATEILVFDFELFKGVLFQPKLSFSYDILTIY